MIHKSLYFIKTFNFDKFFAIFFKKAAKTIWKMIKLKSKPYSLFKKANQIRKFLMLQIVLDLYHF